jgi:hypothetical protein
VKIRAVYKGIVTFIDQRFITKNMMVNNPTSINKRNNHLSLQTIKHDGQQFNQYQQKEQPSLIFLPAGYFL